MHYWTYTLPYTSNSYTLQWWTRTYRRSRLLTSVGYVNVIFAHLFVWKIARKDWLTSEMFVRSEVKSSNERCEDFRKCLSWTRKSKYWSEVIFGSNTSADWRSKGHDVILRSNSDIRSLNGQFLVDDTSADWPILGRWYERWLANSW